MKAWTDEEKNTTLGDHLDALVDVAGDIFLVLDTELVIQAIVDPGTPTLGYGKGQLGGEPVTKLLASSVDSNQTERFRTAISEGVTNELVIAFEAEGGSVVSLTLSAVSRSDSEILCVLEERSTDHQRTLQSGNDLFETVADPVYELDSEDRLRRVNDAMVELTGYDRPDLLGRTITDLVPVRSYERLRRQHEKLLDGEQRSATTELTIITNEGTPIVTEAHITVQTDTGTVAGSVGTLRDIRERKQRERNLELLNQVLTRVFRHNVRNELMVTRTHVELLEDQIDPALHSHTAEILETSDRLLDHSEKARLIETIIEHDIQTEISLTETIAELVDTTRDQHSDATITLDLPPAWSVKAHPNIDRAVEELIDNAIRHAPGDNAQLEIWVDRDGTGETLFLEDHSGGLAPEEIQVLRSGTEEKLKHGSGVGLWLVRLLAEYSGAELIVHTTSTGTVVGIRFGRQDTDIDIDDSPLARAPEQLREHSPTRFHGDTIIGRTEALDRLEERYDNLDRKGGHTVLVTGEAGIGKTTLVEQFREQLADRADSPVVAAGYCNETVQPPYHAFKQILQELPVDGGIPVDARPVSADDATEKAALFEEMADQLQALATDQPVVLVVEDMQWADGSTVALFEYLVEEVGRWRHPVLFVGTYRTSDINETHPVLEVADETADAGRGTVLELEPLEEGAVTSLLSHILGIDTIPPSFAREFHEQTGGTPLFVQELGHHLAETVGPLAEPADLPENLRELSIPDTVEWAITDRLNALPEHVRPVLNLGAVIGQTFTFDILREASEQPIDTLINCIDTLVDRQVWSRSGDGLGFVHGIIREQTLEDIDDDDRKQHHERVAAAIKTVHADELPECAAQLGHHYDQAERYDTAFAYYRQAGDNATETHANKEAITHYERARSLAAEHDVSTDKTVAAVTVDLGSTFEFIGEYEQATDCYEESLSIYQEVGDRRGEADCLDALGSIIRKRGVYEQAMEFFEQSIEIRRAIGDRAGEATGLKRLGNIAFRQFEFELASEYYERSRSLFREIGDQHGQAKSRHNLGLIAKRNKEYSRAKAYFEQNLKLSRETNKSKLEWSSLNSLGTLAHQLGSYERTEAQFKQGLEIARQTGNLRGESTLLTNLGMIACRQGEYERAKKYLTDAVRISREIGIELPTTKVVGFSVDSRSSLN